MPGRIVPRARVGRGGDGNGNNVNHPRVRPASTIYQMPVHELRARYRRPIESVFGVHAFYDGTPHTSLMTFAERETAEEFARRLDHTRRRTGQWPSRTVLQVNQPLLLEDYPDSERNSELWRESIDLVVTPVWQLLDRCEEAGLDLVIIGDMVEHGPQRFSFDATAFRNSGPRDPREWAQKTWDIEEPFGNG